MIRENTKRIFMNIISFGGDSDLDMALEEASNLLTCYASGENIETFYVK